MHRLRFHRVGPHKAGHTFVRPDVPGSRLFSHIRERRFGDRLNAWSPGTRQTRARTGGGRGGGPPRQWRVRSRGAERPLGAGAGFFQAGGDQIERDDAIDTLAATIRDDKLGVPRVLVLDALVKLARRRPDELASAQPALKGLLLALVQDAGVPAEHQADAVETGAGGRWTRGPPGRVSLLLNATPGSGSQAMSGAPGASPRLRWTSRSATTGRP